MKRLKDKIPKDKDTLVQIKIGQLGFYGLVFISFFIALVINLEEISSILNLTYLIPLFVLAVIVKLFFEFILTDKIILELSIISVSSVICILFGINYLFTFIVGYSAMGFIIRYIELTLRYYNTDKELQNLEQEGTELVNF